MIDPYKSLNGIKVLIADDQEENRFVLRETLSQYAVQVCEAENGQELLAKLEGFCPDLIISDISMPVMDGLEAVRVVKTDHVNRFIPFLLLTAQTTAEALSEGFAAGADDYIKKPFSSEELIARVAAALRTRKTYLELKQVYSLNRELSRQLSDEPGFSEMTGRSELIREVFNLIAKVADSDVPVLITGESGSGKELAARALHAHSSRSGRPFIVQNCAAFNDQLLESELFGHLKGSFTGAAKDKAGLFEIADGGTFFLDEIGEMSPTLQAKLLRVLQDGTFLPVGAVKPKKVDVRILAATHRNLPEQIKQGKFREDLWYRLNVVSVSMPALRNRRSDIPLLADSFIQDIARRSARPARQISNAAMASLVAYDWPGNIRQLRNEIERATLMAADVDIIQNEHFSVCISQNSGNLARSESATGSLKKILADVEKRVITEVLNKHDGNKSEVARELEMSRTSLIAKVKEYGLE